MFDVANSPLNSEPCITDHWGLKNLDYAGLRQEFRSSGVPDNAVVIAYWGSLDDASARNFIKTVYKNVPHACVMPGPGVALAESVSKIFKEACFSKWQRDLLSFPATAGQVLAGADLSVTATDLRVLVYLPLMQAHASFPLSSPVVEWWRLSQEERHHVSPFFPPGGAGHAVFRENDLIGQLRQASKPFVRNLTADCARRLLPLSPDALAGVRAFCFR